MRTSKILHTKFQSTAWFKFLNQYAFIALSIAIIVFEFIYVTQGKWAADFWQHASVINELSNNLWHPQNPIIGNSIPHAFFSPYSFLIAVFSNLTKLNTIQSLAFFSMANLIILLVGIYKFCGALFNRNHVLISVLGLLLMLIFWGNEPFIWSGFYHVFGLHYVLPYPSTFAMGISFFVLAITLKNNDSKNNYLNKLIIIVLTAVVIITHPTTAVFLFVGILSIHITIKKEALFKTAKNLAINIVPGILLSMCWPYYSILDLLLSGNNDFHTDSLILYSNFISHFWPLFFIVLSILFFRTDIIIKFFIICISLSLFIYIGGYFLGIYGVSRIISNAMMMSQLLIAYTLIISLNKFTLKNKLYVTLFCVSLITSLFINRYSFKKALNVFKKPNISYYKSLDFLKETVGLYDIVLSDNATNLMIPAFSGKVIATGFPLYWVDDINDRRNDVDSFFSDDTTNDFRKLILEKYHPKFILINKSNVALIPETKKWLRKIGKIVYAKDGIELIQLY